MDIRYRHKSPEVEAVYFDGSTTQGIAIKKWLGGEIYSPPAINTRDRSRYYLSDDHRWISSGDWLVRYADGTFVIWPDEEFNETFTQD